MKRNNIPEIGNNLRDFLMRQPETRMLNRHALEFRGEIYKFELLIEEDVEKSFIKAIASIEAVIRPKRKWYQFWK